jgi:hypothetical protein
VALRRPATGLALALECEECEPWRLFDCGCRRGQLHGWVTAGIFGNANSSPDRFNGPVTFYDRDGEFNLNQLYFIAERAVDTEGYGWDFGGRVDLLYGTDYRYTTAAGLDAHDNFSPRWNSSRFYGLAMPQLYAEVGYNDLTAKIGHFYTIIGYETVTAPDNFFPTHAYTMQYGEPFTHTGVLFDWTPNDQVSFLAGVTNGWDTFDNQNGAQSFLGGITFSSSDKNTSLTLAITTGDERIDEFDNRANRTMYSIVFVRNFTDRLTYVFQHDWGQQRDFDGTGQEAEWYGINQYLFYKINCCWTAGVRVEWFRDDDGFRVAGLDDGNVSSAGGFQGNFYEVSLGLNWKPTPNFVFRPEVRWDWFDGNDLNGVAPFDAGTKNNQFMGGFDFIYLY